uniref:Uncharacterized protein n=1 Tax=Oryza sativa subsp. japonica TaxID=39947 RepID=Q6YYP1_ORYSJ|nr:hypothetical protein [Oryza sativa Japonica Group]
MDVEISTEARWLELTARITVHQGFCVMIRRQGCGGAGVGQRCVKKIPGNSGLVEACRGGSA